MDYGRCVVQLILHDTNLDFGLDATEFTRLVTGWDPACPAQQPAAGSSSSSTATRAQWHDRIADAFAALVVIQNTNNNNNNARPWLPRPAGQDDPGARVVCNAIAELLRMAPPCDANVFDHRNTNNNNTSNTNIIESNATTSTSWIVWWVMVAVAGGVILLLLGSTVVVVARRRRRTGGEFGDAARPTAACSSTQKEDEDRGVLDDTHEEEEGEESSSDSSSWNHTVSLYLAVEAAVVKDDINDVVSVVAEDRELEYYCTEDPPAANPNNLEEHDPMDLEEPTAVRSEYPDDEPVDSEDDREEDEYEADDGRSSFVSHWMRDWWSLSSSSTPESSSSTDDGNDDQDSHHDSSFSHQSAGGSTEETLLWSNTTRDRRERRVRFASSSSLNTRPQGMPHHGGVPIRPRRFVC